MHCVPVPSSLQYLIVHLLSPQVPCVILKSKPESDQVLFATSVLFPVLYPLIVPFPGVVVSTLAW